MKKDDNNKLSIELQLYALEKFTISVEKFENMYFGQKTTICNDFELKTYRVMKPEEKIKYKSERDEILLNQIQEKIVRDIEFYKHINSENIFIKAGANEYEVLYRYESEAGKLIKKVLEKELAKLANKHGIQTNSQ